MRRLRKREAQPCGRPAETEAKTAVPASATAASRQESSRRQVSVRTLIIDAQTVGAIMDKLGALGHVTDQDHHEEILRIHRFADLNQSLDELAGDRRVNGGLHFHGFDNEQPISFGDILAGLNDDARHGARNGRAHVTRGGQDPPWRARRSGPSATHLEYLLPEADR